MNNLQDLFKDRIMKRLKEIGKYSRLIFNDHLSIILFGLIGFLLLIYQQLLNQLSGEVSLTFRLGLTSLITLTLVLFIQFGSPYWLNEPADDAYLFGRGKEWLSYWRRGLFYSMGISALLLVPVVVILMPLIAAVSAWQANQSLLLIGIILLLKMLQLFNLHLNVMRTPRHPKDRFKAGAFMVSLAGLIFLSLWVGHPWHIGLYLITILWLGLFTLMRYQRLKDGRLNFHYAIQESLKQRARFYKFVSLFANVPEVVPSIKRRKFLDPLIQALTLKPMNRYQYYYLRLMMRNDIYSGIWIRVSLFIAIMYQMVKHSVLLSVLLGGIGYLLTTIQLLPILRLNHSHPFQKIYPVQDEQLRIRSFKQVLLQILMIQSLCYLLGLVIAMGFSLDVLLVLLLEVGILVGILYGYLPFWFHKYAGPNQILPQKK